MNPLHTSTQVNGVRYLEQQICSRLKCRIISDEMHRTEIHHGTALRGKPWEATGLDVGPAAPEHQMCTLYTLSGRLLTLS